MYKSKATSTTGLKGGEKKDKEIHSERCGLEEQGFRAHFDYGNIYSYYLLRVKWQTLRGI